MEERENLCKVKTEREGKEKRRQLLHQTLTERCREAERQRRDNNKQQKQIQTKGMVLTCKQGRRACEQTALPKSSKETYPKVPVQQLK